MNSLAVILRRKFEKMVKSNNFKFKTKSNVFYDQQAIKDISLNIGKENYRVNWSFRVGNLPT